MTDYIARTFVGLATMALFACSNSAAPDASTESKPSFSQLRNDDCGVKRLHGSLYETILGYDGQHGLHVVSPMAVEVRTTRIKGVAGFIGHDQVRGMYFKQDNDLIPMYFSQGYVPNGDEMACDLAERLLAVAESQR